MKLRIGDDCVCMAELDEWSPVPRNPDVVPTCHEVVTVQSIITDIRTSQIYLRIGGYPNEYGIEAFRTLTHKERQGSKVAKLWREIAGNPASVRRE